MTVVFGEPISQIDRSVFEDVATWEMCIRDRLDDIRTSLNTIYHEMQRRDNYVTAEKVKMKVASGTANLLYASPEIGQVLQACLLYTSMDVYFSNHTFTCSMLYSPVMTAVWSFMATNRTLS